MNRNIVLTGLAVLLVAGSGAPASAQVFGTPAWGHGVYAAGPCTCGTSYGSARLALQYRSSSYAWGTGPFASYPYENDYYGGIYASAGSGWSDDEWRQRSSRDGRRYDRVDIRNQTRLNEREIRGGRENSSNRNPTSRTFGSGESRTMTRGGAFRGGANSQFGSGTNPLDFTVRSSAENRGGREDIRGRTGRASVRTESRTTTRGGAEIRGGANSQFGSGTNPLDFTVRSNGETSRAGTAALRAGATGQTKAVGQRDSRKAGQRE